jgi:hypothetical protein
MRRRLLLVGQPSLAPALCTRPAGAATNPLTAQLLVQGGKAAGEPVAMK